MNKDYDNQIEDLDKLKSIELSLEEKQRVFSHIESFMKENPINYPILSPFGPHFIIRHIGLIATATLFISLSSASYAAEFSLPGDILYPVKLGVNERIIESLAITPKSKTEAHISLIKRRIDEIQELVENGNPNEALLDIAKESLKDHTKEAAEEIKENLNQASETSLELSLEFEAALDNYDIASTTSPTSATSSSASSSALSEVETTIKTHKAIIKDHIKNINKAKVKENTLPLVPTIEESKVSATTSSTTISADSAI